MSWREKMGPATFRGVAFFVETAERSGGRRTVRHEYPFRDEPFLEDTGRKARTFPVEGYVVGAEYLDARDALLDALETEGPGELVHPYYGTLRVIAADFRVQESRDRGGMARFSIEFAETPSEPAQPTAVPDAAAQVRTSAAAAREAVGVEFLATYSPGVLLDSVAGALRAVTSKINQGSAALAQSGQQVAALKRQADLFEASIASLVTAPGDLLAEVLGLFDTLSPAPEAGAAGARALLAVYHAELGERPPSTTATRAQEQANFDAVARLNQRAAAVRAAELVLERTFDTYEDALAVRNEIADLLDEQTETVEDSAYAALVQLRADLVKAVPGEGSDLARLLTHTPVTTMPSLVLAHRLYGDVTREAEVIARNRVQHPGFVLGGRALKVLSRG
jgi:prophage DNA circulation protein